ncbi:MAG: DUF4417 domain-containing protein [Fibrobacteraceae bacterium]|nr:DUF4417 domain-containing protein [Fibrobacteraceae bacterium]
MDKIVKGCRMVKNIMDLCKIADEFVRYLQGKGVPFNEMGFPIFKREMFLEEIPEQMVPYDFRKNRIVKNPKKTLLVFYGPDARIYPRIENVLDEIPEYGKYMGAAATDVTITSDMDQEWQDFIMLLNQLVMAVLAVNRIKIVANLRTGNWTTHKNISGVPKNVMWVAGFLGCSNDEQHDMRFISTVMIGQPAPLLIYGKEDSNAIDKLSMMGVKYLVYPDYHRARKGVA